MQALDDHAPVQLREHPDHLTQRGAHRVRRVVAQHLPGVGGEHRPARLPRNGQGRLLHREIIAEWRTRIETTFGELTDTMDLARHGAHTFHGLLTRTAATIAAHTIGKVVLAST